MNDIFKNKKQILIMTAAVIVSAAFQAFALTSFSVPAGIYPSGISGMSRLVSDILKDFFQIDLPFFYLYLLINIALAVIVYKHIGKLFTIFSVLQTSLVSLFSSFFPTFRILDDPLLIALFGGVISGFGVSIALTNGASSGGTDFLSIYYSNKYHRSMWDYVFAFNSVLIFIAGMLYHWQIAAYSIIFQYASNMIVSKRHKRYTHQAIIIVTKKPDEVIGSILKNVRHGITKIAAKGAYKGDDETLLYTVVNAFQTTEVVKYALEGDPQAFIETRNTLNVYGNYYQKPLD
ncbi:MAG: YitT family protein [Erysipelotrichaceae bacterium]|nr:YitT family protein [Erysipelotrichaceae bacterium]